MIKSHTTLQSLLLCVNLQPESPFVRVRFAFRNQQHAQRVLRNRGSFVRSRDIISTRIKIQTDFTDWFCMHTFWYYRSNSNGPTFSV